MVMMQILQAASQLSENFKKSEITADFCKLNTKSELKLSFAVLSHWREMFDSCPLL